MGLPHERTGNPIKAIRVRDGMLGKMPPISGFTDGAATRSNGQGATGGAPLLAPTSPCRGSEFAATAATILAARGRTEGDA